VTLRSVTNDVILWQFARYLSEPPRVIYFDNKISDEYDGGEKYTVEPNNTQLRISRLSFADAGTYLSYSSSPELCVTQLTVIGQSRCLLTHK